jgi:hypothetical protein
MLRSLRFDLGRSLTCEIVQRIAAPDSGGQSPHCRPSQTKRLIDLRVGDFAL